MQGDLFAPPPPAQVCGGCVHRNGLTDTPTGWCPWHGQRRHDDAPADNCWFGTAQLNAALYGRKLTFKGAAT